jgi:hypothetical protein
MRQRDLCFPFMAEKNVGYIGFTIQCTETGPQEHSVFATAIAENNTAGSIFPR